MGLQEKTEIVLSRLRMNAITKTTNHRIIDRGCQATNHLVDLIVVTIRSNGDQAKKEGDDQVVKRIGDDRANFVQENGLYIRNDLLTTS